MHQVDIANYFSIIFSLITVCSIGYGFSFVYVFYPFISIIKVRYNFYSKNKLLKEILFLV